MFIVCFLCFLSCFISLGQYFPSYLWIWLIFPLTFSSSHCRFTILSTFIPFSCFLIFPWWIPQWWFLTFQSYFWKWCWKLNWNFVHRSDFCQQVDLTFDPLGWQLPFLMGKTAHYYLYWRLFLFWKIFTQEKNSYCFFEHLNPLGLSWGRLKFHTSLCA